MHATLWNLGAKVADVEKEAAFLVALGAKLLIREKATTPAGEIDYAILTFGDTRILLTPKTVFEGVLPDGLRPGLTHAVFEVADLAPEAERAKAAGATELLAPTEVEARFGRRKIAFFRSPGGIVFEIMQVIERGEAD
jgi:catechol 2,3-dioxygenase-like lactoylglutathione lyase family enzyme